VLRCISLQHFSCSGILRVRGLYRCSVWYEKVTEDQDESGGHCLAGAVSLGSHVSQQSAGLGIQCWVDMGASCFGIARGQE